MKARVKATGEIVEIHPYDEVYEKQKEPFKSKKHKICHLEGIEIFDEPDYWTRLKHQYTGIAMNALLLTNNIQNGDLEGMRECNTNAMVIAHALVEKYKKEE